MSRKQLFVAFLFTYLIVGTVGFHLCEPETTWLRAVLWTVTTVFSPGSDFTPTNQAGAVFQAVYIFNNFMLLLVLGAMIVPFFIDRWHGRWNGEDIISRWMIRGDLILLVDPVDWEKSRSVWQALCERYGNKFTLVVISERLEALPRADIKRGIRFVRGSLRDSGTYERAGLKWAKVAFVCASSYDHPEADLTTSALVELIELQKPDIISIAEVVTPDNAHYFTNGHFQVDGTVVFDSVTLAALARRVKSLVGDQAVNVIANTVDNFQYAELRRQLRVVADVHVSPDGREFRVVLPTTLDDPAEADVRVRAELHAQEDLQAVGLYVSVLSGSFFGAYPNVLCADQLMAEALVEALAEALEAIK